MKILNKILLASILTVGFAQAKDKDFSTSIEAIEALKVGVNKVNVSIKSKTIPVYDADVKLKVYHSDKKIVKYRSNKIDKNGNYVFNVELPDTKKYNYLLSYNRKGGVIHRDRGSFKVQ